MSKVLHLGKRESHRLTVAKYVRYNVSLDFSIKYNLQSEFTGQDASHADERS